MDTLKKLDLSEISPVSFAERAKAMSEDMDALGETVRKKMVDRLQRDEIREMLDAGAARAPIRAEVEEVLQAWEKQISEQRKMIDRIRQAMTVEED